MKFSKLPKDKRRHSLVRAAFAAAVLACSGPAFPLAAAPTNSVTPKAAPAPAAPAKAESFSVPPPFLAPPVPPSAFVLPKKSAEGRDPFFPKSTRVYGVDPSTTKPTPAPVAELILKGISGTEEKPLAIINTTTFAPGEDNDVMTKAGRMRIRCVEINKDAGTVLIQVGGERRELRLAPVK